LLGRKTVAATAFPVRIARLEGNYRYWPGHTLSIR
jgi:hypothetical protein